MLVTLVKQIVFQNLRKQTITIDVGTTIFVDTTESVGLHNDCTFDVSRDEYQTIQ